MKYFFLFSFFFVSLILSAKNTVVYTPEQLQQKNDSILSEANLLYKYDKAGWVSGDMVMEYPDLRKNVAAYIVYESGDTVKSVFLNKNSECIYEVNFIEAGVPASEKTGQRALTGKETELLNVKNTILNQLVKKKYKVGAPAGFSLNTMLIPFHNGYKFYVVTGTSHHNVVPFGNDFLFMTDNKGKIKSWKKFHTALIPIQLPDDDKKINQLIHSHVVEPFMSATDISTFKSYGALYNISVFSVYSVILKKIFTYNIETDEITIQDIESKKQ